MYGVHYERRCDRWIVRQKTDGKWQYVKSYENREDALRHATSQAQSIPWRPHKIEDTQKRAICEMIAHLVEFSPKFVQIEGIDLDRQEEGRVWITSREVEGLGTVRLEVRLFQE